MVVGLLNNLESFIGSTHAKIILDTISNARILNIEFGAWQNLDSNLRVIYLNKDNFIPETFESHKINQDIHVVLEGKDEILVGDPDVANLIKPYDSQLDYALFTSKILKSVPITIGSFVMLELEEIHTNRFLLPTTKKMVFKRISDG